MHKIIGMSFKLNTIEEAIEDVKNGKIIIWTTPRQLHSPHPLATPFVFGFILTVHVETCWNDMKLKTAV